MLHDLPSGGCPVHLLMHVRRFFCSKSTVLKRTLPNASRSFAILMPNVPSDCKQPSARLFFVLIPLLRSPVRATAHATAGQRLARLRESWAFQALEKEPEEHSVVVGFHQISPFGCSSASAGLAEPGLAGYRVPEEREPSLVQCFAAWLAHSSSGPCMLLSPPKVYWSKSTKC